MFATRTEDLPIEITPVQKQFHFSAHFGGNYKDEVEKFIIPDSISWTEDLEIGHQYELMSG